MSDYLERIRNILGCDPVSGQTLSFQCGNHEEGSASLEQVRTMQRELKLLKKEVAADAAEVRSNYTTQKAQIGTGFGDTLSGAIFGRRVVGKVHVLERDRLRRAANAAQEPFENVKKFIDQCVLDLDRAKMQIQESPNFKKKMSVPSHAPIPVAPIEETPIQFYVFLEGQVKGPFTKEQLLALCQVGAVEAFTQVCIAGDESWMPFHMCAEAQ